MNHSENKNEMLNAFYKLMTLNGKFDFTQVQAILNSSSKTEQEPNKKFPTPTSKLRWYTMDCGTWKLWFDWHAEAESCLTEIERDVVTGNIPEGCKDLCGSCCSGFRGIPTSPPRNPPNPGEEYYSTCMRNKCLLLYGNSYCRVNIANQSWCCSDDGYPVLPTDPITNEPLPNNCCVPDGQATDVARLIVSTLCFQEAYEEWAQKTGCYSCVEGLKADCYEKSLHPWPTRQYFDRGTVYTQYMKCLEQRAYETNESETIDSAQEDDPPTQE